MTSPPPQSDPNSSELAQASARHLVEKKFQSLSSLSEISLFSDNFTRKLALAETQIQALIRSQEDQSKKLSDTISFANSSISSIQSTFSSALSLSSTENPINNFPHIRTLHIANKNIVSTLSRIENFSSVPLHVQTLLKNLSQNPFSLKEVFLEARDLENWRDQLIDEVKKGSSSSSSSYAHSPEIYQRIIDVLGGHFEIVFELSTQIRKIVKEHIGNCYELAMECPEMLVSAVEVLYMIEENNKRINESR